MDAAVPATAPRETVLLDIHPFLTTRAAGLAGSVLEPLYEDSQLKVLAHRVMQRMSLVGLFQLTIPPLELHQRLLGRNLVKLLLVSSETCNFCCSRPCCCHRSSCCGCSGLVLWAQVRSPALKARPLIPKVAGWRLSMTPRPASPLSVDVCAAVAAVHSQFTNSRRSAPTSLTGRQELTSRCNLRVDAVHPVVRRHRKRRRNSTSETNGGCCRACPRQCEYWVNATPRTAPTGWNTRNETSTTELVVSFATDSLSRTNPRRRAGAELAPGGNLQTPSLVDSGVHVPTMVKHEPREFALPRSCGR